MCRKCCSFASIQTTNRTNMVRRYLTFIILAVQMASSAYAVNIHVRDSLLRQLSHVSEPSQKIRIYRNLADVCFETADEKTYLLKMYHEAWKSNDKAAMLDALTDITFAATKEYQMDSAYHYINIIKNTGTPEEVAALSAYFHIRFFDALCDHGKKAEAIESELNFLEKGNQCRECIYNKIANAYITGSSLYFNEMMEEALPYLKTAFSLSEQLPTSNRKDFKKVVGWCLANVYSWVNKLDSAVYIYEICLNDELQYYDAHYKDRRPFYNIAVRKLQTYSMILLNVVTKDPRKADSYWQQIVSLSKDLENPIDRYNYFLSMNNYYMNQKPKPDYPKALIANDSLIKYAAVIMPNYLPGLYDIKSQIHEVMGNHQEALNCLRISSQYKDSLANKDMHRQLSELQVKYDLNKLSAEKSQLEIKNKRILLISLSVILVIVVIVCLYLYHNLKKEKAMKKSLRILNRKAMESEKMKTAFINSICHEIRTPLNAIVGFSDLIFNQEIDEETRKEFPKEIQNNTEMLISLINSMLEVSNLDVSEEKLPCSPTDIIHICRHEMDSLIEHKKSDIVYQLELPDDPVVIPTHERYLSLVVEHLLNNANKFTEKGTVILSCRLDAEKQQLYICVTDTGCGIPQDKYEEVFERFSKLNAFTQGNGLGLYLCQLVIKRLSGTIHIDPLYVEGTRVVVTLPVA